MLFDCYYSFHFLIVPPIRELLIKISVNYNCNKACCNGNMIYIYTRGRAPHSSGLYKQPESHNTLVKISKDDKELKEKRGCIHIKPFDIHWWNNDAEFWWRKYNGESFHLKWWSIYATHQNKKNESLQRIPDYTCLLCPKISSSLNLGLHHITNIIINEDFF